MGREANIVNACKRLADITTRKVLMAAAALASLTALISVYNLCFIWFHQPQMPESVSSNIAGVTVKQCAPGIWVTPPCLVM
jgi:cyclic lactone autoinducer peptide